MTADWTRRRTSRLWPWAGALVVLAAALWVAIYFTGQARLHDAEAGFALARHEHTVALALSKDIRSQLTEAIETGSASLVIAANVLAVPDTEMLEDSGLSQLRTESAALSTGLTTAQSTLDSAKLPVATELFATRNADQLLGEVDVLRAEIGQLKLTQDALQNHVDTIEAAQLAVENVGVMLLANLRGVADSALSENLSATNISRQNLMERAVIDRTALDPEPATGWDETAPQRVAAFLAAADAVRASHLEHEAERSGPLAEKQRLAEAFARSIAGNVHIEFVWLPTLVIRDIEHGRGGSGGGNATNYKVLGISYAEISITNSIGDSWDQGPSSAALVAHEVGHAMTSICYPLFSMNFDSGETWATAWAIGRGYDDPGNGEYAYGRPSEEEVALTTQCR